MALEKVQFSSGKCKSKSSKLTDDNSGVFEECHTYLWLAARLPELVSKVEKN